MNGTERLRLKRKKRRTNKQLTKTRQRPIRYQLVVVVCSVNVFDNDEFFQFTASWHGNTLCWWKHEVGPRIVPEHSHHWYRGRDRTERIQWVEEQILERIGEVPHISTRRLAAEAGVSQFIVHRRLKEQGQPRLKSASFGAHWFSTSCSFLRMVITAMSWMP